LLVPSTSSNEPLQFPTTVATCLLRAVVGMGFSSSSTDSTRWLKRCSNASRLRFALPPIHSEHLPAFGSETGTTQNRVCTTENTNASPTPISTTPDQTPHCPGSCETCNPVKWPIFRSVAWNWY